MKIGRISIFHYLNSHHFKAHQFTSTIQLSQMDEIDLSNHLYMDRSFPAKRLALAKRSFIKNNLHNLPLMVFIDGSDQLREPFEVGGSLHRYKYLKKPGKSILLLGSFSPISEDVTIFLILAPFSPTGETPFFS